MSVLRAADTLDPEAGLDTVAGRDMVPLCRLVRLADLLETLLEALLIVFPSLIPPRIVPP